MVGHTFRMVAYCYSRPEQAVSPHRGCPDIGFDQFGFVSSIVCHNLENDVSANMFDVCIEHKQYV